MENFSKLPNKYDASKIISSCARERNFPVAHKVYQALVSSKEDIDIFVFNAFINACRICNHPKEGLATLQDMHQHQVKPEERTMMMLIDLCCASDNVEPALEVLTMLQSMLTPKLLNIIHYTKLMQALLKGGLVEHAVDVLHVMKRHGLQPDEVVFKLLLKGCADFGELELGKSIHQSLPEEFYYPGWTGKYVFKVW